MAMDISQNTFLPSLFRKALRIALLFVLLLCMPINAAEPDKSQGEVLFIENCAGCHINGSSGGLNLSEYDLNINYNSVFDRINLTNNNIMPPLSSESLPQSKIQLINQWINEGALDN